MLPAAASPPSRRNLAELLAEARARTILLASPLSAEDQCAQPDPSVHPILRELDEIVRFEASWLLGSSSPAAESRSYDEWFDRMMEVRQAVLERLDPTDESTAALPVESRARLVLEHEYRRDEALLETAQLLEAAYRAPRRVVLPRGRRLADPGVMARFPGGLVELGVAGAWPEERPQHRVRLEPFWIDVLPVTNGDFITFMQAGAYMVRELWSEAGWDWVRARQVRMPPHWVWEDGAWWNRWMDRSAPLDLTTPVGMLSYYEAEAFARFAGKRLPTELEWEAAVSWDPETQRHRPYPWGTMPPSLNVANLDQLAFEPAPVGAFPGNISPIGCYGLIGDLWEWTTSDFLPYPGLEGREAGELVTCAKGLRVLRGGSW
ncbi:MAG TPA: SUMF1/EgtB/PvdO family nonheme iron enzyme, partial [Gemmatimonadales bacterium]|nr:SUMF1/EgtB/PvdO family nonheme iron enzyme [Gemmatimonadales bacterium]